MRLELLIGGVRPSLRMHKKLGRGFAVNAKILRSYEDFFHGSNALLTSRDCYIRGDEDESGITYFWRRPALAP
jgi:hypothetical protein